MNNSHYKNKKYPNFERGIKYYCNKSNNHLFLNKFKNKNLKNIKKVLTNLKKELAFNKYIYKDWMCLNQNIIFE